MTTSTYFNNFGQYGEQALYESLNIESIRQKGQDMWYVPRAALNTDPIYGASDTVEYNRAYLTEFYIKSMDGFEGDGSYASKFGLEIRDQVVFTITKRVFDEEIGMLKENQFPRPREADLIYFPLNKKCFVITFVDNKPFFYPFGELVTYDLYCELFEYSNETFNTGIPQIDAIQELYSTNIYDAAILDTDGNAILDTGGNPILPANYSLSSTDPFDDSAVIQSGHVSSNGAVVVNQTGSNDIIDWTEHNPFSEGGTY